MNILELFAGSRSIGKVADKLGMNVFSVDWEKYENINLSIDIGELKKEDVPFIPDIIWASPDCTTYTIAAISTHRNKTEPKSDYAKKCDTVNQHFISLIKEWLAINPNMVFFIENPRGMLRHMEWMQEFKRHTVWYCQYGDDRAKPTDIWTNSKTWKPRPECHNYKYDKKGNVIDKHCHHESARRGAKTGTQGKNGHYERSRIPEQLCFEVLVARTLLNITHNKEIKQPKSWQKLFKQASRHRRGDEAYWADDMFEWMEEHFEVPKLKHKKEKKKVDIQDKPMLMDGLVRPADDRPESFYKNKK